ncbi:hypothetical protein [Segatella oris]|nr:hypothetical protein [Segatella oris]
MAFQPLENGKNLQNGFPTPWKWKKCLKTAFQPLGSRKIDVEIEFT